MTGQELYELWASAMADEGIEVGEWEGEVEERERSAWNTTAALLRPL